jgi:ankyrin repeat protein
MDMVKVLLNAGDNPTLGLTEAIRKHSSDIVHFLLASDATNDLNARNGEALVAACESGHLEMITLLLDAGADPQACPGECIKWACVLGMMSNLLAHLQHRISLRGTI